MGVREHLAIVTGIGMGALGLGDKASAWWADQEGILTLDAQKAIECTQEGQCLKATGGVCVQKGKAVIRGDTVVGHRLVPLTASSPKASAAMTAPSGSPQATSSLAMWKDITVKGHVRIDHPNGTITCDEATYDAVRHRWTARGKCIEIVHADWHVVCRHGSVQCDMTKRTLHGTGEITWTHRKTQQHVRSQKVELTFAHGPLRKRQHRHGSPGSLGLGPVQHIRCTRSVTFWSPKFHGKAGRADYYLTSKIIDLDQGVVVAFGSNIVQSRTAQWNIDTKTLNVPPSSGEPVRAFIVPVSGSKEAVSQDVGPPPVSSPLGRRAS